jgi:hypothetical protein
MAKLTPNENKEFKKLAKKIGFDVFEIGYLKQGLLPCGCSPAE